jgi:hypothetical protein
MDERSSGVEVSRAFVQDITLKAREAMYLPNSLQCMGIGELSC